MMSWWFSLLVLIGQELPLLNLTECEHVKLVEDDTWNKYPAGEITHRFYHSEDHNRVAEIRYRLATGQIGLMFVDQQFNHTHAWLELFEIARADLLSHGMFEAWEVVTENNNMWSTLPLAKYKRHVFPESVTGMGYIVRLQ
jgi:hypothetical protein